jgi:hypothetical protein
MTATRPVDHGSRMEASRARLVASRKLCLSTAVIIREARITINRTLDILGIGFRPNAADDGQQVPGPLFPADLSTRAGSRSPRR